MDFYEKLNEKLKDRPIDLPKGDTSAYQLQAWLNGYIKCNEDVKWIIHDLKEEEKNDCC